MDKQHEDLFAMYAQVLGEFQEFFRFRRHALELHNWKSSFLYGLIILYLTPRTKSMSRDRREIVTRRYYWRFIGSKSVRSTRLREVVQCRHPVHGMSMYLKETFPEIDFSKMKKIHAIDRDSLSYKKPALLIAIFTVFAATAQYAPDLVGGFSSGIPDELYRIFQKITIGVSSFVIASIVLLELIKIDIYSRAETSLIFVKSVFEYIELLDR